MYMDTCVFVCVCVCVCVRARACVCVCVRVCNSMATPEDRLLVIKTNHTGIYIDRNEEHRLPVKARIVSSYPRPQHK